jgi:hypothetical protein
MSQNAALLAALGGLGLTATEAEVYVATLAATVAGPASSYRIARNAGRDPANLGKVLGGLVRRGAVSVVQDRPRLYEPVPLAEFSATAVERVRRRRAEALDALAGLEGGEPTAPRLLPAVAAARAQAASLLAEAKLTVTVHGRGDVLADLRTPLGEAAGRGCRVRTICAMPVAGMRGEFTLLPADPAPPTTPWLQLVIDDAAWLVAGDTAGDAPVGCWGRQGPVAAALRATLDSLRLAGGLRSERAAAGS